MQTYKVTLRNAGGHERRETITAPSQAQAEHAAELKRPGYGALESKLIS